MVVDLYAIDHGYGFCRSADQRVFFRIEDFHRVGVGGPLPICGERVSVGDVVDGGKTPRATDVRRKVRPESLTGRVRSFDPDKGWGFVEHGGEVYFLHRSDLSVPFVPIIGSQVVFYAGMRRGRPRACYVTPDKG